MTEYLTAPAKLTLSLRIVGVRSDDHHLIEAEMVSLAVADSLIVDPTASGFTIDGPFKAHVPTGRSNLVAKALRLVGRTAGVHLTKQIPAGGGLGGGSADAAAILRWAGCTDPALAVTLGADVPFCVVGGRAWVRGVGDVIEPMTPEPRTLTLLIPPLHVSTAAAYDMWDQLGGRTADGDNDLEPAAIAVEPRLAYWRDWITDLTGTRPTLAGSGATWWLDGHHAVQLAELGNDGATVIETST